MGMRGKGDLGRGFPAGLWFIVDWCDSSHSLFPLKNIFSRFLLSTSVSR